MTNIFDVAKYILEQQGTMSTMKLQKLCYYAQVWSLTWDNESLFDEDYEAWANGPVCNELFQKTKGRFSVTVDDIKSDNNLTDNQKDTINKVIDYYGIHDVQWLNYLSQMETHEMNLNKNIISKESIAMYYKSI